MVSAFDSRLIRVGVKIKDEVTYFDQNLDIVATGQKFLSTTPAVCDIRISNLTKDHRNYILTQASPQAVPENPTGRQGLYVTLEVGRESYGMALLYEGNSFACNATQPPDIGITLVSLVNNISTGYVQGFAESANTTLRSIAQKAAQNITSPQYPGGLTLNFTATDRKISNFSFTQSSMFFIDKLNQMGGIKAWIDNGKLNVIDANATPEDPILINMNTGMVGVPQVNDSGVNVTVMVNNAIEIGKWVKVESDINPAANGIYQVGAINFQIASRNDPFYYHLYCSNLIYQQGTV